VGPLAGAARWRYLADDGVSASFGLAADEVLARRQGTGQSLPTLRLYTYRSHCALVGRFQRLASEVRLDACEREGLQVNRRPTGGGAILMGEDQLGVAIALPERRGDDGYGRTRELFGHLASGIVRALAGLGITAEFRRKNDVEVRGKKIAGLGLSFDPAGGLLFHSSLLVDLDISLMLRVLRTPFEKISDKEIATVAERVTTIRRELGWRVTLDEVRDRVRQGYADALGVALEPGGFLSAELEEIRALERERYASAGWLGQEPATPDTAGAATVKTEGGLVSVQLALAGDTIKAVYLTGDFFCDEAVVAGIERALRWHPADAGAVRQTLAALEARDRLAIPRVPGDANARAVAMAADAARLGPDALIARGCFVDP
jgi:lipoate-protein ligase A